MSRRRFLAYEDVAERPGKVVQRIVEGQDGTAGQPEHDVHTLTLERLEDDART